MRYPKLRELKEAITALVKGPVTTKFPKEAHIPPVGFRGRPTPSDDGCIACGACAEVCPADAIEVINGSELIVHSSEKNQPRTTNHEPRTRSITWYYDRCIFCGQCERLCTTRDEKKPGVKLSLEFDLATTDRTMLSTKIEKELITCDGCGCTIAAKPHLKWLIVKLGPLAFGNFDLNYFSQKELLGAKRFPQKLKLEQIIRQDSYKINCPKCRHTVLVSNQMGK